MFERLDRILCNYMWDRMVPNSLVYHLHRIKSDHQLLAIRFDNYENSKVHSPFYFLSRWLSHIDFNQFVNES